MIELNETQAELQGAVARFAATEIEPHARKWDEAEEFPQHLFPALGELGWLGIGFDPAVGGSGGGPVERCILVEELARASAGVALGLYVHMVLATNALVKVADTPLAVSLAPALLRGELRGAWAYAEPDAGADVTRASLRARRDGDTFVLDGTKLYITNGPFADVILVVVRTGGDPGTLKGLSVLVVDGDTPGLSRRPMRKLGMRASELGELVFTECAVPAERLVGEEGSGFRQCLPVLSEGRVFGAALALGLGRAAVDEAVRHVMVREQFGGPLAELQAVRFTVADMVARLAAARSLVYGAAEAMAAARPFDTQASVAKLVASETGTYLAERALHLHGAAGFMDDSPVQRLYRDCKILEYGEGANEVQREMIFKATAAGFRP
ncbi:MAG: acyl-CoA dehydrogenase family protein [Acidimicrobiia bacterium]|nr:acyl-CoA dehydrogenase family protein [Acidimicrobiia bacterium]